MQTIIKANAKSLKKRYVLNVIIISLFITSLFFIATSFTYKLVTPDALASTYLLRWRSVEKMDPKNRLQLSAYCNWYNAIFG